MADSHVSIFDSAIVFGVNDQTMIGEFRETTLFSTDQGDRFQLVGPSPLDCLDNIWGIPADAHDKDNIPRFREI